MPVTAHRTVDAGRLAGDIPDPHTIRASLERCTAEADLLRRLLRLALRREREAARLAAAPEGGPERAA